MGVIGKFTSGSRNRWLSGVPSRVSLRQILGALGLATAIPLLALAAIIYQQMLANQRVATRESLMGRAQSLASLVDNEIDTHVAVVGILANSLELESGNLSAFRMRAIKALEAIPGAWVSVSDVAGVFLTSTLIEDGRPLPPRGRRDVMAQAWATGKPQLSDVAYGPVSQRQNAMIEYPVFKAGKPLYTLVMGLNPDRFHALIKNKFPDGVTVGIIDRQQKFVARVPDHEGRLGKSVSANWQAALSKEPQGFIENTTLEGVATLQAYLPTRDGWTVGIAYPKAVLDAPITRVFWTTALAGAVLTLASLLLTLGISQWLGRAMTALTTMASHAGKVRPARPAFTLVEAAVIADALHTS